MHFFGDIQRKLLRVGGSASAAVAFAGGVLRRQLAEHQLSRVARCCRPTFIYRQQRLWGATPVIASWQLVMSGALQVISLALLGLGSAFFLGAKHNPFSLIFTLAGFVMLIVLAQAVASRPDLLDGLGVRALSWVELSCAPSPPTTGWPGGARRWRSSNR